MWKQAWACLVVLLLLGNAALTLHYASAQENAHRRRLADVRTHVGEVRRFAIRGQHLVLRGVSEP